MQKSGPTTRRILFALVVASVSLVGDRASAWLITQQESLRDKARAGEGIVYPAPVVRRSPGELMLHEAEGLCPTEPTVTPNGDDGAIRCRTIRSESGARRDRITIDTGGVSETNGLIVSELARAMDAIESRDRDRLASIAATAILPSAPFQPPDTDGTEWTDVAFGIAGPVTMKFAALKTGRAWALFERLAKTMMLPGVAVIVAIGLLFVGLRRLRQRAELT